MRGRGRRLHWGTAWGCVGAQLASVLGYSVWLCNGAVRERQGGNMWLGWGTSLDFEGAQHRAAQGRSRRLRRSVGGGCARALCGAAQGGQQAIALGHIVGLRSGTARGAVWGRAIARHMATQRRSPGRCLGPRWGAFRGCAWPQQVAALRQSERLCRGEASACAGAQCRATQGRSMWLRRGAAGGFVRAQRGAV